MAQPLNGDDTLNRDNNPEGFYALEVLRAAEVCAYRPIEEDIFTVDFDVVTSLGVEHTAKLTNAKIAHSNGGVKCIVGDLEVGGDDVGLGVIFTNHTDEKSYCCFCP